MNLQNIACGILLCFACVACEDKKTEETGRLYWPETSEFEEKSEGFQISPKEAHQRLVEKTRDHPDRWFDPYPHFIVDNKYVFTHPEKTYVRLTGFYVDAETGSVEYRKSEQVMTGRPSKFPDGAFLEIQEVP